jgi:hypothetical protein
MTGYSGVEYDDDRQRAAAGNVGDTWDAVTGSRKYTSALGSVQNSSFWGHEEGAVKMQNGAADLFDALSALLVFESDMLRNFEAKMHVAMKRFTGTEYENALALKKLQADEQAQAIRSQRPDQFNAMIRRFGLTLADLGFDAAPSSAPLVAPPTASGAPSGVASNNGPVTQDAQPEA